MPSKEENIPEVKLLKVSIQRMNPLINIAWTARYDDYTFALY